MTTLTPTTEDIEAAFKYTNSNILGNSLTPKAYLAGLLAERQRGLLNLAKERERSERLLTQLEGMVLCFKEHGTNLDIPFLIDHLNTSIEAYEKESDLNDKRCSHGVWLADRCFTCDPNTGVESIK